MRAWGGCGGGPGTGGGGWVGGAHLNLEPPVQPNLPSWHCCAESVQNVSNPETLSQCMLLRNNNSNKKLHADIPTEIQHPFTFPVRCVPSAKFHIVHNGTLQQCCKHERAVVAFGIRAVSWKHCTLRNEYGYVAFVQERWGEYVHVLLITAANKQLRPPVTP